MHRDKRIEASGRFSLQFTVKPARTLWILSAFRGSHFYSEMFLAKMNEDVPAKRGVLPDFFYSVDCPFVWLGDFAWLRSKFMRQRHCLPLGLDQP